jgi:hypothetical protein
MNGADKQVKENQVNALFDDGRQVTGSTSSQIQ